MSKLRPELLDADANTPALQNWRALELIRKSVLRRRTLAYGKLDDEDKHCAMGCFWADHPRMVLNNDLIDQVAAVNDSVPPTVSPRKRWEHVKRWLLWKTA